ncbi:hypothetical protein [Pseudoxanthomonas sp. SORGH_AS_0997]|uniref:hypothetical protein n=1 Tax=Pseudoxanthomonas sp. SORGH_AS_0997 TaxID=3041776 RepID=UPI00285CBE12|nr:hypothetical protein [Pseudoxanthomonas sp. SORGH_AS_0997]MDR6138847.1 hypothetical protein [Pseudoxanthomonas sp. SORGH_AS_0997]
MQLRILMLALSVLQGRLLMPGLLCLLVASMAWVAVAEPERTPLIIDMHLHAPPAPGAAPASCLEAGGTCASPEAAAAVHRHTQAQLRRYNVIGLAAVQDGGQPMPAAGARAPGHLALDPLRIDAGDRGAGPGAARQRPADSARSAPPGGRDGAGRSAH